MPHLSPGCGSWDLSDQHKVWALLAGDANELGPLRIMESGALHPQHSVVAASGVTHRNFSSTRGPALPVLRFDSVFVPACSVFRGSDPVLTSQEMK